MKPSISILLCVTVIMFGSCSLDINQSAPPADNAGTAQLNKVTPTDPAATAAASVSSIWPPNHKMHTVTFTGQISNYVTANYTLTDDDGIVYYSGTLTGLNYSVELGLEASRSGKDKNGRIYTFTANAVAGPAVATATSTVTVSHN